MFDYIKGQGFYVWMLLRYPEYRKKRDKTCPLVPCIGIIRGYKEHKPKLFDFDDEVEEE